MFLATTAIEEFWDRGEEIIFLGEWCKLFNRKEEWMLMKYEEAPFLWDNADVIIGGIKYCDKVYEKKLIEIAKLLNEYHGINKDTHYYRIVLGNWLICFIHQFYDKYLTLKKVFEKYPDAQTYLLDEEQYYIPVEYGDYLQHLCSDKYALQLYSQILTSLGYNFERRYLSQPIEQLLCYSPNSNLSGTYRAFDLFLKVSSLISLFLYKKTVTITAPYFSYNLPEKYFRMLFESRFRCIADDMHCKLNLKFNIDQRIRKQKLSLDGDEFEAVLSNVVLSNMPIIFLEGFASLRTSVMKLPIRNSKAFFTASALGRNYIFKFFVAEHYRKVKLLNGQHGGGYGIDFVNTIEKYEESVVDIFYTAGWKKRGENTVPLAVPKFFSKEGSKDISSDMVLFTINEMPRYIYRLQLSPLGSNYVFETLNQILAFLKYFQKRNKLLIRTCPLKLYGWDTNERISDNFNDCFFDDLSRPFDQMLRKARVFLTSGAHTTYLEALAANKPTVIFLSDKVVRFRPDAQPYFERLQDVNILHYSPISAAEHLNAVYDDVDEWWQNVEVQDVRKSFVEKYARSSANWAKEWVKEFNRVLSEC